MLFWLCQARVARTTDGSNDHRSHDHDVLPSGSLGGIATKVTWQCMAVCGAETWSSLELLEMGARRHMSQKGRNSSREMNKIEVMGWASRWQAELSHHV